MEPVLIHLSTDSIHFTCSLQFDHFWEHAGCPTYCYPLNDLAHWIWCFQSHHLLYALHHLSYKALVTHSWKVLVQSAAWPAYSTTAANPMILQPDSFAYSRSKFLEASTHFTCLCPLMKSWTTIIWDHFWLPRSSVSLQMPKHRFDSSEHWSLIEHLSS